MAGVSQHLHAEGLRQLRGGLADAAVSHDAEGLALELHQRVIPEGEVPAGRPLALMYHAAVVTHMQRDLQQQRHGELGHRGGGIGGHIGHDDAAFLGFCNIDHVVARGQHADVAQIRTGGHHVGGNDGLVGEDDGRVADAGDRLLGGGVIIDGQLAQGGKRLPAQVARILHSAVQHDDLGHIS